MQCRRFLQSVCLLLATMPLFSHAIEEPAYQVVKKIDAVEVRQYAPYVVAEVVLKSVGPDAASEAFPILAGYIFGKNKGEKKLEMTAPVTQTSVRMEMTAPVTQATVAGGTLVQFVLPKDVNLDSAPEPLDPRVKLRLMPAAKWAVLRYSGTWSQANYDEHVAALRASLEKAQISPEGEPVLARYDPPFMPWFLRRNEVWLALR